MDETVYIDEKNMNARTIHTGTKFSKKNNTQFRKRVENPKKKR
jgi:hypothetical protein